MIRRLPGLGDGSGRVDAGGPPVEVTSFGFCCWNSDTSCKLVVKFDFFIGVPNNNV